MDFVRPIEAIVPGAQGRMLAVLAETTAHLNLKTISQLSGVSPAQASRVLPGLVELGVVERHEVPPSSLLARRQIKQIKRSGRGFRNFTRCRPGSLLAGGHAKRDTPAIASSEPAIPG